MNNKSRLFELNWNLTNVSRDFDLRESLARLRKNANQGAYSHVYVSLDNKYVVKIEEKKDFEDSNVLRFGTIPGIEKSSVRIHAWASDFYPQAFGMNKLARQNVSNYHSPHVIYVMDHASYGNPNITETVPFSEYQDRLDDVSGPQVQSLIGKIRATLKRFYITTQAFHGDLHGGNIMINLSGDNIESVVIIDYGNMIPFKSYRATNNQTIDDILANGHRDYRQQVKKINNYIIGEVQANRYKNNTNRVGRSNRNMIRVRGMMIENDFTPLPPEFAKNTN